MKLEDLDEYQGLPQEMVRTYAEGHLGLSTQAVLRDVNPRWRDGWPSDAALDAHRYWLIDITDSGRTQMMDSFVVREWKAQSFARVRCWPCDRNAARVRWSVDANGNML